jgi:hypothetical protein
VWASRTGHFACVDSRNAALHRLLIDAQHGGQAKVDALIALAQRTVFVVPWPNPADGYRTLVNSNGMAALPIFTDAQMLQDAATRFGWVDATGKAVHAEVGSRQALAFARDRGLAFVVVDIAADHSLEISAAELEPLLSPAARRESQGAFMGAGRISSTLMRSVQPMAGMAPRSITPPPGSIPAASPKSTPYPGTLAQKPQVQPPPPGSSPGSQAAPSTSSSAMGIPAARSKGTASSPGMIAVVQAKGPPSPMLPAQRLAPLRAAADPGLLDMLDIVLREYPEVEWACLGLVDGTVALGLRVDPRVRSRLEPLAAELGRVSNGTPIVLLDDAQLMRAARTEAFVFYPWRKKS